MMQAGLGAFAPSAVGAAPPMPPVPTQPGGIAPLPDPLEQLLEQSRMIKRINAGRAGEGQRAGAQAAQGMPTVKEQIARALGAAPYGFAGGGIVAFADGGLMDEDRIAEAYDREQRETMGESEPGDGSFWEGDIPLIDRIIRQFGGNVPVSKPRPGAEARARDRGVTLPTTATQPFTSGTGAAAREADMPAAAAQPAATPAARSAAPAGATPDVQSPPAARSDGLGDAFNAYRRQQDILADLVKSQGGTPEEVLEAQRRYDEAMAGMLKGEEDALAEMEAAAKANVFDNDEILAGILAGMQGTDRLGETLLGAATGAARGRASQKKAVAEAKKDLNKLRRDLAMKQAELQLARKEGDVNRARTAAIEVQKIKVAIEERTVDQRLKEMDAETRRIAAEAAMTSAQQRGEARTELTPYQRSQILNDVTKEVDGNTGIKVQLARIRDAGAREQLRQQIIKERYDQAVAAAEGRTLPATSGAPATAPGAAPTLSPADRALIEKYQ